jgi:hypothetical protein
MSVFAIHEKNEFGDEVPTGGVFVSNDILSCIFEEDVIEVLDNLQLDKVLYEEALSTWRLYRRALIEKEIKEFWEMIDYEVIEEGDEIFFKTKTKSGKKVLKRGQNSQKKHRQYEIEKIGKKRRRVVENSA